MSPECAQEDSDRGDAHADLFEAWQARKNDMRAHLKELVDAAPDREARQQLEWTLSGPFTVWCKAHEVKKATPAGLRLVEPAKTAVYGRSGKLGS